MEAKSTYQPTVKGSEQKKITCWWLLFIPSDSQRFIASTLLLQLKYFVLLAGSLQLHEAVSFLTSCRRSGTEIPRP